MAFIDMRMPPGWDGLETIEHIWQIDPEIMIVICTAYSDLPMDEVTARLKHKEKLLILKKPFEKMEIKQIVASLTHQWLLTDDAKNYLTTIESKVNKRTFELHQSLEKNKQQHIQLLHADKMASIGSLAAGVAHEINNPLGFISSNFFSLKGYLDTLLSIISQCQLEKSTDIYQEQKDTLNLIIGDLDDLFSETEEGMQRIQLIVAGLRSFSRKDQGDEKVDNDINECLQSTLKVAANEIKHHAIVETNLAQLPLLYCHAGELNQAFLNIVVNAIQAIAMQHQQQMGKLEISTEKTDKSVIIVISDNGSGMPDDVKKHIFDPFYTTKKEGEGTGLGLHITWDIIVNRHGGTIDVESQVEQGTKFTIHLPRNIRDINHARSNDKIRVKET